MFPAGVTNVSLDILIVDDNLLERDEQFTLNISSSLPPRVSANNFSQARVTIQDNDGRYSYMYLTGNNYGRINLH